MLVIFFIVIMIGAVTAEFDPEIDNAFRTLPEPEFAEYFNSLGLSWRMTTDGYGVVTAAGARVPSSREASGIPFKSPSGRRGHLPDNFDAREKWPHCSTISEVYSQGSCGDCFVFAALNVASDRHCIHKNESVRLSPQEGNCIQGSVCEGGFTEQVFKYWINRGVVSTDCKPYDVLKLKDVEPCEMVCSNTSSSYSDKHFGKEYYWIRQNEDDIKAELVQNGPIVATFLLYSDIERHQSGVYVHYFGECTTYHSVRVIGYGVENGAPYWLAANTWGKKWGENGFFKIQRYQNSLSFEMYMISGMPR